MCLDISVLSKNTPIIYSNYCTARVYSRPENAKHMYEKFHQTNKATTSDGHNREYVHCTTVYTVTCKATRAPATCCEDCQFEVNKSAFPYAAAPVNKTNAVRARAAHAASETCWGEPMASGMSACPWAIGPGGEKGCGGAFGDMIMPG